MSNIIERAKERKKNTTPFPGNMAKSKDEKKKAEKGERKFWVIEPLSYR